jgi:hypothetical protein
MHFGTKNTLKNNHNHTPNQTRRLPNKFHQSIKDSLTTPP